MGIFRRIMEAGLAADDFIEKNPGIAVSGLPLSAGIGKSLKNLYDEGKDEGRHDGYVEASYEYEKKLLKQAEEFLNQKEIIASKRREYDLLLDEYETYINELEKKVEITEQQKDYLNQLLMIKRKLRKLK